MKPKTEEIEAILRRCDHDGDGALSYAEFCALCEDPPTAGLERLAKARDTDDAVGANRAFHED